MMTQIRAYFVPIVPRGPIICAPFPPSIFAKQFSRGRRSDTIKATEFNLGTTVSSHPQACLLNIGRKEVLEYLSLISFSRPADVSVKLVLMNPDKLRPERN